MRILFFTVPFILILSFSVAEKASKAPVKMSCTPKELKIKNCIIEMDSLRFGLSSQKIRFSEGPWTSIADFPSSEKVTHWQNIEVKTIGHRRLLSIKVWQKLDKEVDLEELHWLVFEAKERSLRLHIDKTVGKRKMRKEQDASLIQDELKKTKLWSKEGRVYWSVGKESGEIEKWNTSP